MNTKLVTICVVAAVAALMVGTLAIQAQNAFANQFDDQQNIQVNRDFHGKNNVAIQQNNVNGDNKISGGIHLR
jgi:hypothetical protein